MDNRHNIAFERDGRTYTGQFVVNRYVINGGSPITTVTIYALGTQQTAHVGDFEPEEVARMLLRKLVESRDKRIGA
jgi:hypothetical protein